MIRKKAILGLAGLGLLASGLGRELYVRKRIEEDMEQSSLDKKNNRKFDLNKLKRINPYIIVEEKIDPISGKKYKDVKRDSSTYVFPALGIGGGLALLGLNRLMYNNTIKDYI